MKTMLVLLGLLVLLSGCLCEICSNPTISSTSFTSDDATYLTNIAFISVLDVKCSSGKPSALYANVNGNIVPLSNVDSNKYQVSWTEDTKKASRGDKIIKIYDEENYSLLKKAQRSGEDLSSVPSFGEVVINYPGSYNGPWIQGELFAVFVSIAALYLAISFKSQITS